MYDMYIGNENNLLTENEYDGIAKKGKVYLAETGYALFHFY